MNSALLCLATAIFFEAGIEPIQGKEAVAQVIVNRVEDGRYPNTVCGVVWEDRAFSFTHDGKSDKLPNNKNARESISVAKAVLSDDYETEITSTHYHANYVNPYWNKVFTYDGKVGSHLFYTNETRYK